MKIPKYLFSFAIMLPLAAQWTDLSSTTLKAVAPVNCKGTPSPAYCTGNAANYAFNDNAVNVMNAWGGAAADTVNNRMIIWGGGHVDYSGNEVYSLNLGVSPPTMTRLTDPSPFAVTGDINPDNTPISRHTYGGLVYLANENAMFAWGDGVAPNGGPSTNTWWFNLSSNTWTRKAALPTSGNSGLVCQLDTTQATESVVCVDFQYLQMFRYTPATNTWAQLSASPNTMIVEMPSCAVHPDLKVMICAGASPGYGPAAGIYSISLAPGSTYAATNITSTTSGCSALYSVNAPGLDYDSSTGQFVSYSGSGNSVTLFDAVSGICTTRTFSGGPTAVGYANGVWGRFAYFPKLNKHVILNNATADAFALTLHSGGLGHSTLTCLDIDGDGYGTGPGCLGPDADDNDAAVHSSAQVIAKYGSINAFLAHIGYQNLAAPLPVYCVSPTGNDSTGVSSTNADTACTKPYATWLKVGGLLSGPYIVIYRAGTWTANIGGNNGSGAPSGTQAAQSVIMAYPGELPFIDVSAGGGTGVWTANASYLTVDGFKIKANGNGAGYGGGTYILYPLGTQPIRFIDDVVRRCEIFNGGTDSNIDADNIINFTVEENVVHDPYLPYGQHNIYLGSNTAASTGVVVTRNIAYNVFTGGYPNLQFNGRCTHCRFEQNIFYNADGQQIGMLQGVSNSFIRGNLVFNTGTANNPPRSFSFYNYDSGQCGVTGLPSICPWDQTGNVVENNTFWAGTQSIDGTGPPAGFTVTTANEATAGPCGNGGRPPCGNMGGNTWRNNVVVDLAGSNADPPVYYFPTNTVNYLAMDTWSNNVFQNAAGSTSLVATEGGTALTCATFILAALSGGACSATAPAFVSVSPSFFSTPSSFNFAPATGSVAIGAGTAAGAPALDLWGNVRSNSPTAGAIESASTVGNSPPPSSCDLNSDGLVNILDVQLAIGQALGTSPCTNADLQGNGQCNVVDVQRMITASLGGSCQTGQ